jgi:hypothetical protein
MREEQPLEEGRDTLIVGARALTVQMPEQSPKGPPAWAYPRESAPTSRNPRTTEARGTFRTAPPVGRLLNCEMASSLHRIGRPHDHPPRPEIVARGSIRSFLAP